MPQPKLNVLITGTSTGIGRLTAIAVAQAGHYVFASMRDRDGKNLHAAEELRELARRDGLGIEVIDLDVTEPESVSTAIQGIASANKDIDVLVNNAGQMSIGIAEAFTEDQIKEQFAVNRPEGLTFCNPGHVDLIMVAPHATQTCRSDMGTLIGSGPFQQPY